MRSKSLIAVLIALLASSCMLFTACGEEDFDASGYVKESLDFIKSGNITDEYLTLTGESKEEAQKEYNDVMQEVVDEAMDVVDVEAYKTDENEQKVRDFVKAMFASLKYEVSEEATKNDDGSYSVETKIYPVKAVTGMESYIENDLMNEWEKKITNGSYKFTTEDQLMIDVMNDMFQKLTDQLKNTEYGDPQTVTLEITFDEDEELYEITDESMDKLLNAAFGDAFGEE